MPVFMVDRNLQGISMEDLAGAQKAAIATAEDMSGSGVPIRYLRSTFTPETGRCQCLFESESADRVRALNDTASLPYEQVIEVLDLTP